MKQLFFLLSVLIVFGSCKKEVIEPECPIDHDSIPVVHVQYLIGNSAGFEITVLDSALPGSYNSLGITQFDLDGDGYNDIEFKTGSTGSPAQGTRDIHRLKSIGTSTFFHVHSFSDSSFYHIDIDTLFQQNMIRYRYTTTCERMASEDSIISVGTGYMFDRMYAGDSIGEFNNWMLADFNFANDGGIWNMFSPTGEVSNGFDIYQGFLSYTNCHKLPYNEVLYIGFKHVNNQGTAQFGWLKILITSTKVYLIETAIRYPKLG